MLESIESFLNRSSQFSDKRIVMQIEDVRIAIGEVLHQLTGGVDDPDENPDDDSLQKAIQVVLSIARENFVADLRIDVSVFDQPAWDVRALRDRSSTTANSTLYFTRHGTLDRPLPAVYGDVVKSWIIIDRRSVGNMGRRSDAARILWDAIERRRKGKAEAFSWQNFSEEDLSQAELLMRAS
jgi:hypothetical protein